MFLAERSTIAGSIFYFFLQLFTQWVFQMVLFGHNIFRQAKIHLPKRFFSKMGFHFGIFTNWRKNSFAISFGIKIHLQSKVLWKKIPSWTIKHQKSWQVKNDFWTWKNQWRRRHFVLFCDLNKIFFQLKFLYCSLTWNWLISKSIYRWKIATHPSVSVKKKVILSKMFDINFIRYCVQLNNVKNMSVSYFLVNM